MLDQLFSHLEQLFHRLQELILCKSKILHRVSTKMNCSLECDFHEYTPCSVVLVGVFQVIRWTSTINLSYDRKDLLHVRYCCWRHMKIMWPFSTSSFGIPRIFWSSGCNRFHRHFFLVTAPRSRILKFPWFLTFICRGRFLRYFNHQPAKVCIFQPSLRIRRCVRLWISSCPRVRFPWRCFENIPRLFDAIG